jgi:tetratricopeptide (TPR) repeat protein
MLYMNDGQQIGSQETVNHWDMGRRLLDRVRPEVTNAPKAVADPGHDETVRLWYLATGAHMAAIRQIELNHFLRSIELFPDDPELLMSAAAIHESFAGVRTQSAIRKANIPRDVDLGVRTEGQELRLAEQLYKRALEANPKLLEARIRLGRVLGLRGRHEDAAAQLRQGVSAAEPILQYYAHLFLAAELETLGNEEEARRSYQRAAALYPTAQSPLLGLSRVSSQLGDRDGAREAVGRVLKLPADDEARGDPWWVYEIAFARDVNERLEKLRKAMVSLK